MVPFMADPEEAKDEGKMIECGVPCYAALTLEKRQHEQSAHISGTSLTRIKNIGGGRGSI
jgi:hypothetical protein